jgi:hypothetical protein
MTRRRKYAWFARPSAFARGEYALARRAVFSRGGHIQMAHKRDATLTRGVPTCKLRRSSCRAVLEVAVESECSAASLASGSTLSGKCGSSVPIRFVGGFCSRPDRRIPQQRPTERKLVRVSPDHRLLRFNSDRARVAELSSEVMDRGGWRSPRFARDLLVPCQRPWRNSTRLVDRKPEHSSL